MNFMSSICIELKKKLTPLIETQRGKPEYNDIYNSSIRKAYNLTRFNVVRLDSLSVEKTLVPFLSQIPVYNWPLLDLPSSKLENMIECIDYYKDLEFEYCEYYYSHKLWSPLLRILFDEKTTIHDLYSLNFIENEYKNYFLEYVVTSCPPEYRSIPSLFVEIDKDHLSSDRSHKKEYQIAEAMAMSLMRMFRMCFNRGRKFLSQLKVYGLLIGATDFDICIMYPVFPDPEDLEKFYFVFDSSPKDLRFKILEQNSISRMFSNFNGESELSETFSLSKEDLFIDFPKHLSIDWAILASGENVEKESNCRFTVANSHINNHSLQILERLSQLVEIQCQILAQSDKIGDDSRFIYDFATVKDLKLIQNTQSTNTQSFKKNNQTFKQFINSLKEKRNFKSEVEDDDYESFENLSNKKCRIARACFPVRGYPRETVEFEKYASKYELKVYELVKGYPYFPELYSSRLFTDENGEERVALKLEDVVPLHDEFSFDKFGPNTGRLVCSKLLVDLFCAIRVLHRIGFIHGDIKPSNVGYNFQTRTFQLFDFDNSRPIKEALAGKGDFHGTEYFKSWRYFRTGIYSQFDDYVSVVKTCQSVSEEIRYPSYFFEEDPVFKEIYTPLFCRDNVPLTMSQLDSIFCKSIKIYWAAIDGDSEDPTILNAIELLNSESKKLF